jgi:hypothetical protein
MIPGLLGSNWRKQAITLKTPVAGSMSEIEILRQQSHRFEKSPPSGDLEGRLYLQKKTDSVRLGRLLLGCSDLRPS